MAPAVLVALDKVDLVDLADRADPVESTAAKVVNVACNVAAIMLFGFTGHIIWQLGLMMAVCQVIGSVLGTKLALKHGSEFVRRLFLVVVAVLIVKTGYDAWFG